MYYKQQEFLPGNLRFNSENSQYTVNSKGYRTIEFDDVDWNNSVVLFGCSMGFGVGLEENETISHQLSLLIDRPVINMCVPASSINYACYNQMVMQELGIVPHAVINLWTSLERCTYFLKKQPFNMGPWVDETAFDYKLTTFYSTWSMNDDNVNANALIAKRTVDLFWQNTKHLQASVFKHTAKLLDVEYISLKDTAKDKMHPGPLTAKQIAEWSGSSVG